MGSSMTDPKPPPSRLVTAATFPLKAHVAELKDANEKLERERDALREEVERLREYAERTGFLVPELVRLSNEQSDRIADLERKVERLKEQLTAATAIPNDAQIKKWEAFAQAKISVLNRLAEAIIQDEPASSGWLRQQCGLSADEWHGAGELIAALICFGCDKGFLDWHAAGMADIDMPDQIAAARREGARDERNRWMQVKAWFHQYENDLSGGYDALASHAFDEFKAAAIRALMEESG